ncbi:MAG: NfeD-like C-terminal, partner-binding [Acidimicrobiaceae bacterium]|jgi:membrane-bound ClpP family serine protease|nr:NfeD-like C-terminal, partner-binding [Acidimicrobiaceae bacterium]
MRGRVTMLNGVEGMVGETALVTREVGTSTRPGLVRARGEDWHAVSMFPGTTIGVGTTVVVADVERGLLVVYATDSA